MRKSFFRLLLSVFLVSVFSAGCVKTLVAPYDENLVTSTEAFYKKAAGIVEEGRSVSPRTDQERAAITEPAMHKGHFSKFDARYSDLIVDAEAPDSTRHGKQRPDRHRGSKTSTKTG